MNEISQKVTSEWTLDISSFRMMNKEKTTLHFTWHLWMIQNETTYRSVDSQVKLASVKCLPHLPAVRRLPSRFLPDGWAVYQILRTPTGFRVRRFFLSYIGLTQTLNYLFNTYPSLRPMWHLLFGIYWGSDYICIYNYKCIVIIHIIHACIQTSMYTSTHTWHNIT